MTKIYVTKYALTSGVLIVDADIDGRSAYWKGRNGPWSSAHKNDFFFSQEEALADCERRRQSKIASLDKQRKKLESIKFVIED
ncbi:hypothetical protein [Pectobacterium carotovorum]|uniref:hypothetical protein n=1 Tax=Pectobacterium carotovorum TaxID=554 RepID=UPI000D7297F4|nr:hypothetical protein [Pectobacterium carotovorum]PXB01149.1 hypothetical protein DMB41_16265 [Pectobacterium carotovorum subsp. carotovorum]